MKEKKLHTILFNKSIKLTGTSLRVAMFKRQKSLETQRFLGSISTSYAPGDTLNLQITGESVKYGIHFCRFGQSHTIQDVTIMLDFFSFRIDILEQLSSVCVTADTNSE